MSDPVEFAELPATAFLAKLNMALIGLNSDEHIIFINQAAQTCLALTAEQVLKKTVEQLIPNAKTLLKNARQAKTCKVNTTARRQLNDPFDVQLTLSFFERSYPQSAGQISTLICLDEISQAHLDLVANQATKQLEALSCYSGEIAHDLNNILNVISGHLELLDIELAEQTALNKRVFAAQKGVNRGRILAARLGHLVYYDKADMSLCNVNKVILDNLDLLDETIASDVTITLNLAEQAMLVNLDISHFIDVLFNLCMNASNAMSGSGQIIIKTEAVNSQDLTQYFPVNSTDYLCLSIKDSGCGIPLNIQEKIFDPFFTTKINNKGTGIGLNLVKSYVKIHNGFIWLESEENQGSCFSLYFPLIKENVSASEDKEQNMDIEQKLGGKRVLVIDDEAPILFLLKEFLGVYGLQVQTAHSGQEGLELATHQDFDLILSDLVMPGDIDGAEFASRLLKQKPASSIIFMSGYTDNRLLNKDELVNIPVINKPFRKKELLNRVEVALC